MCRPSLRVPRRPSFRGSLFSSAMSETFLRSFLEREPTARIACARSVVLMIPPRETSRYNPPGLAASARTRKNTSFEHRQLRPFPTDDASAARCANAASASPSSSSAPLHSESADGTFPELHPKPPPKNRLFTNLWGLTCGYVNIKTQFCPSGKFVRMENFSRWKTFLGGKFAQMKNLS